MSVYVLNMGQPVKIVDLAERMIRLSGLQPGHDIDIVFTGMRPGERLNEILFAHEEETVEIGVAGIVAARPREPSLDTVRAWLATLHQAVNGEQRSLIEVVLNEAIPEFGAGADEATSPRLRKSNKHDHNAERAKRERCGVGRRRTDDDRGNGQSSEIQIEQEYARRRPA